MFKEMAAEMTDDEVERCMSILVEGSVILNINRGILGNAIEVEFRVIGDHKRGRHTLSLLPDSVQEMSNGVELRLDGEFLYRQYLVAKGYSELWMNNIFIEK